MIGLSLVAFFILAAAPGLFACGTGLVFGFLAKERDDEARLAQLEVECRLLASLEAGACLAARSK